MILSDFLSRQKIDDSNPHEIIPISFNTGNVLHDRYYNVRNVRMEDKYLVQTQSQSKSSGINLPEVHEVDKGINPYVKPEKQTLKPTTVTPETKTSTWTKPRLGQGRAGLRGKLKPVTTPQPNKQVQITPKPDKQTQTLSHSSRVQWVQQQK